MNIFSGKGGPAFLTVFVDPDLNIILNKGLIFVGFCLFVYNYKYTVIFFFNKIFYSFWKALRVFSYSSAQIIFSGDDISYYRTNQKSAQYVSSKKY